MGVNKVVIDSDSGSETLIDISEDTVSEDTLLDGATAHDSNGDPIVGTVKPVLYVAQELTDEQKAQARKNIGVEYNREFMLIEYSPFITSDVRLSHTYSEIMEFIHNGGRAVLREYTKAANDKTEFVDYHFFTFEKNYYIGGDFSGDVNCPVFIRSDFELVPGPFGQGKDIRQMALVITPDPKVVIKEWSKEPVLYYTSELENDSGYVTLPEVKSSIALALNDFVETGGMLTLTNTSGFLTKTVAVGTSCVLSYEWTSIDEGIATGNGTLKILVNGVLRYTGEIEQGQKSIDVGPYLVAGNNEIELGVTDVYGNYKRLVFTLTAIELTLTSAFDNSVVHTGDISFTYIPTGAVTKIVHFAIDGTEVGTAEVTVSGRQQSFTIPAQSHGCHQLDVWFTGIVEGDEVPSNHLYYTLICVEEGNKKPVVAVDWRTFTVEQYDTLVIPYRVYDPASLTATVSLHSSETGETKELTVDRTKQTWSYCVENTGSVTLTISCIGADTSTGTTLVDTASIDLTVTESKIKAEAETTNLSLYLTSYGRSNNEADPGVWTYGDISANLTGFNFTSDGWMQDVDGVTALRVSGDARVEIPVQLFAKDFRTTGKTIEIEFASRSVLDYDAVLATCWSGDRGLEITAQHAILKSEKSGMSTRYKEDDHLRLSFVIEKRSGNRLIIGYVNGIISGMIQYPDNDDFSQAIPVTVTLGSNDCTMDVYNIRVYDQDLTRFQVLDNWIADTQNLSEKKDRYDRNNVFDDYGRVLPSTLQPHQCYLILDCPVLPTYKGDKKTCSGRYVDPMNPEQSFTFENAEIDVQGTSSQFYYVKNFKIKFKGGFVQNGRTVEVYAMNDNAIPTNTFTFKADVASSEGANNVVLAELYNDLCPVKTPAQEEDPRVRQTIEGHPIVVFHDDGSGDKFIGKYNFNNDKGTAEVFGFVDGDESWEIKENGNAQVSFKTDDFTDWETSFEARYPDKNKDITKLQQFVAWVASTNTEGQTEEEVAVRLEKFKTELSQWADVEDAIFYYLFTLVFLCIDQREKNAFPTWNAEIQKWLWLFYDADSSLGTDNKGNLTFEYWMEDIDYTAAGDPVFNGQNNVFWSNLRECFADEIRDEYRRLRTTIGSDGKALLSYDKVNDLFTTHQSQWSEAIYNEDAWRKAVEPLEKVGDDQYLPMQQGKKEQHFKHFLYNRFRYLDSKFETGAALDDVNRIMMRAHAQGNIWLTSYINMYGQVYYNSQRAEHRMFRDQAYEFEWNAVGAEDAVIGVNSAPMITSLGDLSPLMLEYCNIQYASHLTELKVGDDAEGYENDNFVALTLGNNTLLRKLDVRNCTSLIQTVDASGCANIEEIYFDGSAINGLILPNGGILKTLRLPDTVTDLTIRNQPKLTELVLPSYEQITTLRLENVPDVVPKEDIFRAIPENSRVRMLGFDFNYRTASGFLARLRTMRGLDENGSNTNLAQMSGNLHVEHLWGSDKNELQTNYPDVEVTYDQYTESVARSLFQMFLPAAYRNDRLTTINISGFDTQSYLEHLDLPNVTRITGSNSLESVPRLKTLILRSDSVCSLESNIAFKYTNINDGIGYIYVPRTLADGSDGPTSYAAATNWSNYATQFRAIEDYPEICRE